MRDARPLGVALLGCLGLLTAAGVGSGERAGQARAGRHLTTTRVARRPAAFPFLFIEANDVVKGTYEVTMTCPAHKHGTPEQAMKKLKVMQLAMPADREVRLWACRARQISTVKMFAPAANVIIVNPFAVRSLTGPGPDALVWPGLDQPLINQMRQLRAAAGATRLLACIDVKDPDYLFGKRAPSFEEVRWMAIAATGAGFQGICWRPERSCASSPCQLAALELSLKMYQDELGQARPVNWVRPDKGQALSALASPSTLFVALLHPAYLSCRDARGKVLFPVAAQAVEGEVKLAPPPGTVIGEASSLSGGPVSVARDDGTVRANYRFHGGGDILVFQLRRGRAGGIRESESQTTRPRKGMTE